jgi:2-dehydro-3-deoxyphosphogluconate aldolase/(4S)-4-hydroxy-2-oxoglutarate aldolase
MTQPLDEPISEGRRVSLNLEVRLLEERLLPVLRAQTYDALQAQVAMCIEAGLNVIELTATTPGWDRMLSDLRQTYRPSDMTIGVGTVVTKELALSAISGGADFLVTPYRVDDVLEMGSAITVIAGAFSPTELAAAASRDGVTKLFPANTLGPSYLRSVLDVLPHARIVPTGGITGESARSWIEAGAIAVGTGSRLFDNGVEGIRRLHETLSLAGNSTHTRSSPSTTTGKRNEQTNE